MKKQFCQWMQIVQVTTTTNKNLQVKVSFSKTKLSFLLVFLKEMRYGLPALLLNLQEKNHMRSVNKQKQSKRNPHVVHTSKKFSASTLL